MLTIGLTGPSGAGKTTLCNLAKDLGILSIDADKVYHALLVPPSECLDEIVENFGSGVLSPDKTLDRRALSKIVFSDSEKLDMLNRISHKYVKAEFRSILAKMKNDGVKAVLIDAPTLFESGFDKECDFTVCLLADRAVRGERITQRDSLSHERAEARLSSQKPDEFFLSRADHVLYNNGDTAHLAFDLMKIINSHGGFDEQ